MDVIKKPPNWGNFVFSEKLKWYAKKDNENKNIFADKYKIKLVIDQMNIEGLRYAKIISHVPPIEPTTDLNIVLSVEQILKDPKYQFNNEKVKEIFKTIDSSNQFWEIVKEKYDIERYDQDNPPPKSFVIKLNLGWNAMIFVCNKKIVKIVNGTHNFPLEYKFFYYWKRHILKQYKKNIPPRFFIEEFIGYNLKVYEVYCIYGKPRILSLYYETSVSYENNYLVYLKEGKDEENSDEEDSDEEKDDIFAVEKKIKVEKDKTEEITDEENEEISKEYTYSQTLIQGSHLIPDAKPLDFKVDKKICKQICLYAQEFAKYFEFVRVDFYHHKGEIYFSECTFKPGALKKIKWQQVGKFLSNFWTKKPEV
jgi:hypothetical protein